MFTAAELCSQLFPVDDLGPWHDAHDYTCFLLAATTGMRHGEILALRWANVHLEERFLRVQEAWTGGELGGPKRDSRRTVPLLARMADVLSALRADSIRTATDDLVFCYDDGRRLGGTWWPKRFARALEHSGIDPGDRTLTAHSFRHTVATLLADAGADPEKIRALSAGRTARPRPDTPIGTSPTAATKHRSSTEYGPDSETKVVTPAALG